MKSKIYGVIAATVVSLSTTMAAHAVPVYFDINFTATSGTSGTGSFSVDSAALDAIPLSGTYFSGQTIDNFSFTFGSVVFDQTTGANWTASDGQITGLNGICCSTFTSSTTADAQLRTNTSGGAPTSWNASANGAFLASGSTYVITQAAPVPLPAGLPLMLAGLGAFAIAKRRRKTA